MTEWPGKNWVLRILDPEEHFSKSSNWGTYWAIFRLTVMLKINTSDFLLFSICMYNKKFPYVYIWNVQHLLIMPSKYNRYNPTSINLYDYGEKNFISVDSWRFCGQTWCSLTLSWILLHILVNLGIFVVHILNSHFGEICPWNTDI